jgi:hypothetical protein
MRPRAGREQECCNGSQENGGQAAARSHVRRG